MIPRDPTQRFSHLNGMYFFDSARQCWEKALLSLQTRKVLLPAYIGITDREGSGIFDPVRRNNLEFGFYRFDRQLVIDLEDVHRQLESGDYDTILVVHYFGIYQEEVQRISALAKESGVQVVEDFAHLFNVGIETAAGCPNPRFYSVHKCLPSASGGILKMPAHVTGCEGIAKAQDAKPETLLDFLTTDLSQVARQRRSNFRFLAERLANVDGLKPLRRELGEKDIPHDFPVIIGGGLREKLYFEMKDRGVDVIALYYRLIEEIDRDAHPNSYFVSDNILNLPVHQDLTVDDLKTIADVTQATFAEVAER